MTGQPVVIYQRQDLRWAEAMLQGESLQPPPAGPADFGTPNPEMDTRVIPWGGNCHHNDAACTSCPYHAYTPYGSSQCAYLKVEAYDHHNSHSRVEVAAHFGGESAMQAAGVVGCFFLCDRLKICGVNEEIAYFAEGNSSYTLAQALADYKAAVAANFVQSSLEEMQSGSYSIAKGSTAWQRQLKSAYARHEVWIALCNLVESVPVATIESLRHEDARLRMNSLPSEEPLVDATDAFWGALLAKYPQPMRQFWYLYLKPLA